ncbi:hypothetical protein ACOSQ2_026618 [Xanthoceras sorbifolium]|uniref:TPX2 C-terminal domain-containing protein n=1 Tax=Xanthoceras sorbifolium TaxID=99658 RepID=A0ABQ8HEG6_9ROSI|nr:hypothetical protein JRO89_XS11G0028300 [Xanthoceras sorbifolium]
MLIFVNMEKSHTKSALKFVKASSQSAVSWSSSATGMEKYELKDRLCYKFKANPKTTSKENTKPQEFTLHTQQRAVKRAMFNYSVATKEYLEEIQKKRIEKLQKMIEEEEIKLLRKEMVPRAQLMPYFDRPFFPQRSNRPLTIPREPSFLKYCSSDNGLYHFDEAHAWKPIK